MRKTVLAAMLMTTMAGMASADIILTKDSAEFTYRYEMTDDPTDHTKVNLDGNSIADWSNLSGTVVTVNNGILTLPDGSALDNGIYNAGNIWPNVGFNGADGFSFEISLKVVEQGSASTHVMPLVFALSDSTDMGIAEFRDNGFKWGSLGDWNVDTTADFHIYRFSRNADNKDGLWWIWRDGLLMTPNGLADTTIYTRNAVYLGPAVSGSSSGIVDIDYIRLTNGAFAPVPEPGMLTFLSLVSLSLLAIRRKAA